MSWSGVVTLGNVLTMLAMAGSAVAVIIAGIRWQTRAESRIGQLEEQKVDKLECKGTHGVTVTTEFCRAQHAPVTAGMERMTEDLGALNVRIREIGTNQQWVMDALRSIHSGVKIANPHPKPLPPDPEPPGYPEGD